MKGKLTIFFSYTPNVGKTKRMIKKAIHESQIKDVVIEENGLDIEVPFHLLHHFDHYETVLERKPDLFVISHQAFTKDSYLYIEKLLNEGIDVYTTLNVYHLESSQESIKEMMRTSPSLIIPDSFFDNADSIIFIDKETNDQPEVMLLRELAIRKVNEHASLKSLNPSVGNEHILACLSSSPSNAKVIKTASRMAKAFNGKFTAIFIQTSKFQHLSRENKQRLVQNQNLAKKLGAQIETVYGDDVSFQIAEYARLSNVTKIVLGQSQPKHKFFSKPTFAMQLMDYIKDIDIHIIPDGNKSYSNLRNPHSQIKKNLIKSFMILIVATLLSILFEHLGFTDANIIMVYILGVLLTSVVTTERIYSLVSSMASVIIFNFLFTTPRFTLFAYDPGYPVTFFVMFLTAFITGTFSNRYKEQARLSAEVAYRTQILFETNQLLSKAKTKEEMIQTTANQLLKLLDRNIIIYDVIDGKLGTCFHYLKEDSSEVTFDEKELDSSFIQLKENVVNTIQQQSFLYLAIRTTSMIYGIIGIDVKVNPLDSFENSLLLSILGECALALENAKNIKEKEEAALLAQSEQLRANLLRSISHDLRTPLTSISGNASHLLMNSMSFDEQTKKQFYEDIYNDSIWLISLIENLLASTKFEEGKMQLRTSKELLSDLIDEAYHHIKHKIKKHTFTIEQSDDFLLVNVDAKLIIQVIINIVDNAIKYTQETSSIQIIAKREDQYAVISIIDNGSGLNDYEKERIFDKFYCGENKVADNRRSLGLGLYLCKAIVEAHQGTIQVLDNKPQGTIFTFTLPIEEVHMHE